MGTLSFAITPPQLAEERSELSLSFISGMDRMPSRTQVEVRKGMLSCSRCIPESGMLNVPWPVDDFGLVMLRTATLRERPEPYHLQVELARGKTNQLRNIAADWEMIGLKLSDSLRHDLREVMNRLTPALTNQSDQLKAAIAADSSLSLTLRTAEELARVYTDQVFHFRHQQYPQLHTLLACRVGKDASAIWNSPDFCRAFNAVKVDFNWKDVEPAEGEYNWEPFDALVDWCLENRLVVKGGPLIQWSPNSLPAWLWLWEEDFESLLNFMSDFIETVISRYRGRIRLWEVTARTNYGEALSLDEEKRVRLTVRALRVAREMDNEATLIMTLGQPWAEYMARRDYEYSPLNFADALVRADLGLAAIGLELAMGYEKDASYCRDLLELSEVLDRYAMLGVPLHVSLAAPSGSHDDSMATSGWSFGWGNWRGGWNEQTHADWLEQTIRLAACKPFVQEVSCCHYSDAAPHEFALGGLVRADGTPKEALERVLRLREEHLR